MATLEQIATFLDENVGWERRNPWEPENAWMLNYPYRRGQLRPTPEALAEEWLGMAEFQALRLGTWLGTTDGEAFTQAVELVTPGFYRADIELLVRALKYAAQLQHERGKEVAGQVALVSVVVAGVAGLMYAASKSGGGA